MKLEVQCLYGSELMSLLEIWQDHLSVDIFKACSFIPTHLLALAEVTKKRLKSDSFPEGKRVNSLEMD